MTVEELIKELEQYNLKLEVCDASGNPIENIHYGITPNKIIIIIE